MTQTFFIYFLKIGNFKAFEVKGFENISSNLNFKKHCIIGIKQYQDKNVLFFLAFFFKESRRSREDLV